MSNIFFFFPPTWLGWVVEHLGKLSKGSYRMSLMPFKSAIKCSWPLKMTKYTFKKKRLRKKDRNVLLDQRLCFITGSLLKGGQVARIGGAILNCVSSTPAAVPALFSYRHTRMVI